MAKRRTIRDFAGMTDATSRTVRLLRTVADELERFGVRWGSNEEDTAAAFEWATWTPVPPGDTDYRTVRISAPSGLEGCLLVHRAILDN